MNPLFQDVNLNQLYYFYITATEGSVTRAAKVLNLTQPSVSTQIKALEESVGMELFERKYRKIELTEPGRAFFRKCERIFRLTEDLFINIGAETSGREAIRIGVVPSVPARMLCQFTDQLLRDKSYLVESYQHPLDRLYTMLEEDSIDAFISPSAEKVKRRFISQPLDDQTLVVVSSPKAKKPKGGFPRCLDQQNYVALNRDHGLQEEINFGFQEAGIQPVVTTRAHNLSTAIEFTLSGQGFAVLPQTAVAWHITQKRLTKWGTLNSVRSRFYVTYRRASGYRTLLARLVKLYHR